MSILAQETHRNTDYIRKGGLCCGHCDHAAYLEGVPYCLRDVPGIRNRHPTPADFACAGDPVSLTGGCDSFTPWFGLSVPVHAVCVVFPDGLVQVYSATRNADKHARRQARALEKYPLALGYKHYTLVTDTRKKSAIANKLREQLEQEQYHA